MFNNQPLNKHLARLLDRLWWTRISVESAESSPFWAETHRVEARQQLALAEQDYDIFIRHHPELASITDSVVYMNTCLAAGIFSQEPYLDRNGDLFPYKEDRHE